MVNFGVFNSTARTKINDNPLIENHSDKTFNSILLILFLLLFFMLFVYCLLTRKYAWKMLIASIFGSSSSSLAKNGPCSSIDEQKSILSKYQLFTNDNNGLEPNQRKLSCKRNQDAAKLLANEEKNNLGNANLEDCSKRRMFQETAFLLNDSRSSYDMRNNDKMIKNDRHYSLNIVDDQNFNVSRTGETTLIPLLLNRENDNHDQQKVNSNGQISNGSASIILSPIAMPMIHQLKLEKRPEASWAVQIERTPSPPKFTVNNRDLNLPLKACLPLASTSIDSGQLWTDFRYAIKSPNNVSPSTARNAANGDFRLFTPPACGRHVEEPATPKTASIVQNQTPKFQCFVEDARNGGKSHELEIVDTFDQGISISSPQTSAPTRTLPRSAPGSPNKKRSPSPSPSMHRFNSSSFGAGTSMVVGNGQIPTGNNINENFSALPIFGDEDDQHQKLNRRTSVSSTESVSDESLTRPLTRAMSTDSVDSSFSLTDYSHDTEVGQLELRLLYDSATQFLFVWVLQICDLKYSLGSPDAQIWVVLFLLPFPKPLWRTQLKQNATALSFHEKFHQCVREQDLRRVALLCQLYGRKSNLSPASDLLGQVKIRLKDVQLVRVNTIWLTIFPPAAEQISQKTAEKGNCGHNSEKLGDLLFSLNYQPSTERLAVVISKIKCLQYTGSNGFVPKAVTVRVYLVHGAKVSRKKTSLKYVTDGNVMFNESMIFALPQTQISKVSLRLSVVAFNSKLGDHVTVGQVTVGPRRTGKEFGHWQRMIEQPRTPTNMWHSLQPKKINCIDR